MCTHIRVCILESERDTDRERKDELLSKRLWKYYKRGGIKLGKESA